MREKISVRVVAGCVLFLFALAVHGASERSSRLPVEENWPDLMTEYGKLSKFWAQAASAAPEARVYVEQLQQQGVSLAAPSVGIFEGGYSRDIGFETNLTPKLHAHLAAHLNDRETDIGRILSSSLPPSLNDFFQQFYICRPTRTKSMSHGNAVTHLIASQTAVVGGSVRGRVSLLLSMPNMIPREYRVEMLAMLAASLYPLPQLINFSSSFGYYDDSVLEKMADALLPLLQKTIFVTSAGNNHPDPIELGKRRVAEDMVIVGSTDPTGHASVFSQRGKEEVIRAFSDEYVQTIGVEAGVFIDFGGTSGSAPQVVAALADVLSIVHTLNRNEAATLLRRTAVASSYGEEAGTLNRYKLVRVAHRLVQHGWPTSKAALHDDSVYDFSDEAQALTAASFSAATPAEAFAQLRQAFFLDPDNSQTRTLLAAIYHQAGYEAEALFYGAADPEARDAFIKRREEIAVAVMAKFMAAVAAVDLEEMAKLLPTFSKKDFHANTSTFFRVMRKLSFEQKQSVADFMRQHKIADVSIDPVDGSIGVGRL